MKTGATGPGWKQAKKWFLKTQRSIKRAFNRIQRDASREAARIAKKNIRGGRVIPASNVGPTLMKTRAYVKAIGAYKSKAGHWYVGVPQGRKHPHSDITFEELYQFLEFGTIRTHARPHIAPAAQAAVKKLPAIIKRHGLEVK